MLHPSPEPVQISPSQAFLDFKILCDYTRLNLRDSTWVDQAGAAGRRVVEMLETYDGKVGNYLSRAEQNCPEPLPEAIENIWRALNSYYTVARDSAQGVMPWMVKMADVAREKVCDGDEVPHMDQGLRDFMVLCQYALRRLDAGETGTWLKNHGAQGQALIKALKTYDYRAGQLGQDVHRGYKSMMQDIEPAFWNTLGQFALAAQGMPHLISAHDRVRVSNAMKEQREQAGMDMVKPPAAPAVSTMIPLHAAILINAGMSPVIQVGTSRAAADHEMRQYIMNGDFSLFDEKSADQFFIEGGDINEMSDTDVIKRFVDIQGEECSFHRAEFTMSRKDILAALGINQDVPAPTEATSSLEIPDMDSAGRRDPAMDSEPGWR